MDVDEDDDFYAPDDSGTNGMDEKSKAEEAAIPDVKAEQDDEDLEEGEEEGEAEGSDDSDIDIITERKDGTTAPPAQSRYNTIQNINQRNVASNETAKPTVVKKETPAKGTPAASGVDLPGLSTSKIDVNAKPIYEPAGKSITQVNIDEDLTENDKPWRQPGADVSDYFNYGFDEFTWALYASKQETLRSEFDTEKIAQNSKKMFEDMNMMMAMGGGMPGMMPGAAPGMEGIPPEMQQMMQQMMSQGMDPSQMDPAMFAGMQGNQTGAGGAGAAQAGQGGFGQGQNSQMGGYGFDQGMEARNRGGNFGRGRGGRRNW